MVGSLTFWSSSTRKRPSQTSASPPVRPPRSQAVSDAFIRYQQALAEQQASNDDDTEVVKYRTGSMIIQLDQAVLESSHAEQSCNQDGIPTQAPKELSEVLRTPQLRNGFRYFLKRRVAQESLICFETIELFKRIDSLESLATPQQQAWHVQCAKGIMDQFIREDATFPVNISGADRVELVAREQSGYWPKESFNGVQREMYDLMSRNFFQPFVQQYWPDGELKNDDTNPFSQEKLLQLHQVEARLSTFARHTLHSKTGLELLGDGSSTFSLDEFVSAQD